LFNNPRWEFYSRKIRRLILNKEEEQIALIHLYEIYPFKVIKIVFKLEIEVFKVNVY